MDRARTTVHEVLLALESHATQEIALLEDYQRAAIAIEDPQLRLLVELIVQDEHRHHALMKALAATIESGLSGRRRDDAIPPGQARGEAALDADLLELTNRFIAAERRGIDEDRSLSRICGTINDGLFSLLIDTMVQDSRKHLMILEFIRDRLSKRAASARRR